MPYLRKKLTKNIINGIKKTHRDNNRLKQYHDRPADVIEYFIHDADCIWKQTMNIFKTSEFEKDYYKSAQRFDVICLYQKKG